MMVQSLVEIQLLRGVLEKEMGSWVEQDQLVEVTRTVNVEQIGMLFLVLQLEILFQFS